MSENKRNVRKKHILAILSYSVHPYTSKEIADLCCPVSINSIRTSLKKYVEQRLIKRKKINDIFVYWITPRGLERLEYLLGSKNIKDQIDLLVREPLDFKHNQKKYLKFLKYFHNF